MDAGYINEGRLPFDYGLDVDNFFLKSDKIRVDDLKILIDVTAAHYNPYKKRRDAIIDESNVIIYGGNCNVSCLKIYDNLNIRNAYEEKVITDFENPLSYYMKSKKYYDFMKTSIESLLLRENKNNSIFFEYTSDSIRKFHDLFFAVIDNNIIPTLHLNMLKIMLNCNMLYEFVSLCSNKDIKNDVNKWNLKMVADKDIISFFLTKSKTSKELQEKQQEMQRIENEIKFLNDNIQQFESKDEFGINIQLIQNELKKLHSNMKLNQSDNDIQLIKNEIMNIKDILKKKDSNEKIILVKKTIMDIMEKKLRENGRLITDSEKTALAEMMAIELMEELKEKYENNNKLLTEIKKDLKVQKNLKDNERANKEYFNIRNIILQQFGDKIIHIINSIATHYFFKLTERLVYDIKKEDLVANLRLIHKKLVDDNYFTKVVEPLPKSGFLKFDFSKVIYPKEVIIGYNFDDVEVNSDSCEIDSEKYICHEEYANIMATKFDLDKDNILEEINKDEFRKYIIDNNNDTNFNIIKKNMENIKIEVARDPELFKEIAIYRLIIMLKYMNNVNAEYPNFNIADIIIQLYLNTLMENKDLLISNKRILDTFIKKSKNKSIVNNTKIYNDLYRYVYKKSNNYASFNYGHPHGVPDCFESGIRNFINTLVYGNEIIIKLPDNTIKSVLDYYDKYNTDAIIRSEEAYEKWFEITNKDILPILQKKVNDDFPEMNIKVASRDSIYKDIHSSYYYFCIIMAIIFNHDFRNIKPNKESCEVYLQSLFNTPLFKKYDITMEFLNTNFDAPFDYTLEISYDVYKMVIRNGHTEFNTKKEREIPFVEKVYIDTLINNNIKLSFFPHYYFSPTKLKVNLSIKEVEMLIFIANEKNIDIETIFSIEFKSILQRNIGNMDEINRIFKRLFNTDNLINMPILLAFLFYYYYNENDIKIKYDEIQEYIINNKKDKNLVKNSKKNEIAYKLEYDMCIISKTILSNITSIIDSNVRNNFGQDWVYDNGEKINLNEEYEYRFLMQTLINYFRICKQRYSKELLVKFKLFLKKIILQYRPDLSEDTEIIMFEHRDLFVQLLERNNNISSELMLWLLSGQIYFTKPIYTMGFNILTELIEIDGHLFNNYLGLNNFNIAKNEVKIYLIIEYNATKNEKIKKALESIDISIQVIDIINVYTENNLKIVFEGSDFIKEYYERSNEKLLIEDIIAYYKNFVNNNSLETIKSFRDLFIDTHNVDIYLVKNENIPRHIILDIVTISPIILHALENRDDRIKDTINKVEKHTSEYYIMMAEYFTYAINFYDDKIKFNNVFDILISKFESVETKIDVKLCKDYTVYINNGYIESDIFYKVLFKLIKYGNVKKMKININIIMSIIKYYDESNKDSYEKICELFYNYILEPKKSKMSNIERDRINEFAKDNKEIIAAMTLVNMLRSNPRLKGLVKNALKKKSMDNIVNMYMEARFDNTTFADMIKK